MTSTYYVHVGRDGDPMPDTDSFHPWKNCRSVDEVCRLAANKYLREAGYLNPRSERPVLHLDVYCFPATIERHPETGRPVAVLLQKLHCTPSELPRTPASV